MATTVRKQADIIDLSTYRDSTVPDAYEQLAAAQLIEKKHQAVDTVPSYAERYQRDAERTAYLNAALSLGWE